MAIGKKTGGRDFEPGQSGNPNGRPPTPEDIKQARKLNCAEFERIANKYLHMTHAELGAAVKSGNATVLEMMVASIISKAVTKGDQIRLEFLLKRLIGDPVERIPDEDAEEYIEPDSMSDDRQ